MSKLIMKAILGDFAFSVKFDIFEIDSVIC